MNRDCHPSPPLIVNYTLEMIMLTSGARFHLITQLSFEYPPFYAITQKFTQQQQLTLPGQHCNSVVPANPHSNLSLCPSPVSSLPPLTLEVFNSTLLCTQSGKISTTFLRTKLFYSLFLRWNNPLSHLRRFGEGQSSSTVHRKRPAGPPRHRVLKMFCPF